MAFLKHFELPFYSLHALQFISTLHALKNPEWEIGSICPDCQAFASTKTDISFRLIINKYMIELKVFISQYLQMHKENLNKRKKSVVFEVDSKPDGSNLITSFQCM